MYTLPRGISRPCALAVAWAVDDMTARRPADWDYASQILLSPWRKLSTFGLGIHVEKLNKESVFHLKECRGSRQQDSAEEIIFGSSAWLWSFERKGRLVAIRLMHVSCYQTGGNLCKHEERLAGEIKNVIFATIFFYEVYTRTPAFPVFIPFKDR